MKVEVWLTELDGTKVKPLPSASFGGTLITRLREPGEISLRLDPSVLGTSYLTGREIQLWGAGEPDPLFVGVPWVDGRARATQALTMTVSGLESYLARRFISDDLDFEAVDQLDIAWSLIDWTQDEPSGDLNIDPSGYAPSGVDRDRHYFGDELACVLDELNSWPSINDGFDWSIVPVGGDRREWTPYYPQRGAVHPEWRIHADNVAGWGWTRDRSRITRRHFASAGGEGAAKLVGGFVHADTAAGSLLLLESVSSESTSIRHVETLEAKAHRQVASRHRAVVTVEAEVVDPVIAFGVQPGDTLPVSLADASLVVEENLRVVEKALRPGAGRAVLSLVRPTDL